MPTIVVDGAPIEVTDLVCDPPAPSGNVRAISFRMSRRDGQLPIPMGEAQISFPWGGTPYTAVFRLVGCALGPDAWQYSYAFVAPADSTRSV